MLRLLLVVAIWAFDLVSATTLRQQVISSFVFTRYGDRTPLYNSEISVLTPFGAQQMYDAGSGFRGRYLTSTFDSLESTTIRGISNYQLNAGEISILTTDDQYTIGSAQAFMQGLYPPLADTPSQNYTYEAGISNLANGTNVVAPLDGYQYPKIDTASSYDLNSVWIDGDKNCPAYTERMIEYYNTSDFAFLYESTLELYQALDDEYLDNIFSPSNLGYFNAYYVYDYLQYQYLHNSTVRNTISDVNMTRVEVLAADWVYALYNNATGELRGALSNVKLTFSRRSCQVNRWSKSRITNLVHILQRYQHRRQHQQAQSMVRRFCADGVVCRPSRVNQ